MGNCPGLGCDQGDWRQSFVVQYRNANGRSRRLTVGPLWRPDGRRGPQTGPDRAGGGVEGSDPAENRKLERGALTIGALCQEYMDRAKRGLILTRRGEPKRATTLYTDKGRIEHHIIPLIGSRTVKDLTPVDVRRFMQGVMSGKTARTLRPRPEVEIVTGGNGAASRALGLLGGILSFAVSEGYRTDNPARGIVKPKDGSREWRLDDDGYRELGKCLASRQ